MMVVVVLALSACNAGADGVGAQGGLAPDHADEHGQRRRRPQIGGGRP